MSIVLLIAALAMLGLATFLWQRDKRADGRGVHRRDVRITIVLLLVGGLMTALASQLPYFQAS